MDMRRLILKFFLSEPSIFNRHLKFLCLGSKRVQIFHFVLNLNWFKLLYLCPEIILTFSPFFWLAVWFPKFSRIIALFASWKLLELLYIGFEHKLRTIVSSTYVQDLNRAAPATFRTQIEQIRTHFEQPQIRFRNNMENLNAFWALA
jgi:hypothetical protein